MFTLNRLRSHQAKVSNTCGRMPRLPIRRSTFADNCRPSCTFRTEARLVAIDHRPSNPFYPCLAPLLYRNSDVYGVRVRDRKDAGQDRHDELRVRGVRDGGGFRDEAGPVSRMCRVRGDGCFLCSNGQAHGALGHIFSAHFFFNSDVVWCGCSWIDGRSHPAGAP